MVSFVLHVSVVSPGRGSQGNFEIPPWALGFGKESPPSLLAVCPAGLGTGPMAPGAGIGRPPPPPPHPVVVFTLLLASPLCSPAFVLAAAQCGRTNLNSATVKLRFETRSTTGQPGD